jgi:hypothetical protein
MELYLIGLYDYKFNDYDIYRGSRKKEKEKNLPDVA